MRKTISMMIALVLLVVAVPFSFAKEDKAPATPKDAAKTQEATEVVIGKVASVDTAKKTIVVTDKKTGTDKTFTVSDKAIATVKAGDKVKVKFKTGSDTAISVKIIPAESKKSK